MNWEDNFNKYLEGKTSLNEERDLKNETENNIKGKHELLSFLNEEKKDQKNVELEKQLEQLLDANSPQSKRRIAARFWYPIAALFIIAIGISGIFRIMQVDQKNNQIAELQLSQQEIATLQKSLSKLKKTLNYEKNIIDLPNINYKEINSSNINADVYPFKIKPIK